MSGTLNLRYRAEPQKINLFDENPLREIVLLCFRKRQQERFLRCRSSYRWRTHAVDAQQGREPDQRLRVR
jgi:hypothetical protein